jgi:hypothetical protein
LRKRHRKSYQFGQERMFPSTQKQAINPSIIPH